MFTRLNKRKDGVYEKKKPRQKWTINKSMMRWTRIQTGDMPYLSLNPSHKERIYLEMFCIAAKEQVHVKPGKSD